MSAAHLIANRGPPTSAGQGIVSAIIVIHSYMARKNPAPAASTNSASRVSAGSTLAQRPHGGTLCFSIWAASLLLGEPLDG